MDNFKTTASGFAAHCENLGLYGQIVEDLVRETGKLRHEGRVNATLNILEREYRAQYQCEPTLDLTVEPEASEFRAFALVFLAADLLGIGGTWQGTAGDGTARMQPFFRLGTGRKKATDGGAWMAAAKVAAKECDCYLQTHSRRVSLSVELDSDGEVAFYVNLIDTYSPDPDPVQSMRVKVPASHVHTLLRGMARSYAGLQNGHATADFYLPVAAGDEFAAVFSKAYQRFCDQTREAAEKHTLSRVISTAQIRAQNPCVDPCDYGLAEDWRGTIAEAIQLVVDKQSDPAVAHAHCRWLREKFA